ncbi:hypothetical protein PsorP6_008519 [Peronosclerospora sorghi]|uniref:Uncharacterized protein n=1 Tax=Peronosclerospora sorghi TaxID=230839 RepID=A0ACC0W777_9STRA|nr:hypothetical protein PsorP6_008519 [Peronosclerospora sorghi]
MCALGCNCITTLRNYTLRITNNDNVTYVIESAIETISFNDVFAKTFQFKSPVVDALAVGVAPAESYDDLASLLRRNSSASLHDLHISEESSHIQESVEKKLPKPVESYQKISPNFNAMNAFIDIMNLFPLAKKTLSVRKDPHMNVLHVLLVNEPTEETALLENEQAYLKSVDQDLRAHNIRRVTFSVRPQNIGNVSVHNADMALYPDIYTFHGRLNYSEDNILRHIEAPLAYKLELRRLQNYSVTPLTSENKNVHLYLAKMKESDLHIVTNLFRRIFVRAIVRQLDHDGSGSRSQYDAYPGPERSLVDALNALEVNMANPLVKKSSMPTKNNHVYLNILPQAIVDPQYLEGVIRILAYRYAERLEQLGVTTVELKNFARFNSEAPAIPVRLVAENPTGYVVRVQAGLRGSCLLATMSQSLLPLATKLMVNLTKREMAKVMSNTVYVYDFLELIEYNLLRQWRKYVQQVLAVAAQKSPFRTCSWRHAS